MKKELPACPVETTLMLISDRWKVLIIRDLLGGTKRFGELKKNCRLNFSKGLDRKSAFNGGRRTADQKGLRRGPAEGGIHFDGHGI